ncbi:MAG: SRPBCC family protein [Bacteroidia bacterium]
MALLITSVGFAQKKTRSFTVNRVIQAPIDQVWKHVAEDFAGIAKAHPGLTSSHLDTGSVATGEGCTRVCYLDDKQKKYTKEVMSNVNASDYSFDAIIFAVAGLPLDETVSKGNYKLVKLSDNSCEIRFTMTFRTKPAFMGALAKGKFKSQLSDYLLAVDHYVTTGEEVHRTNFLKVKAQYE